MTTEELCEELACPPETPAGSLLAAWERRRAELDSALADTAHARPVKLRLREERRRLDAAESLAGALKVAAEIDGYLAEFAAESRKPCPSPALRRLCLEKARPLCAQLPDPAQRFHYEKKLVAAEEQLAAPTGEAARVGPFKKNPLGSAAAILELVPVPTGETVRMALPRVRFVTADAFTIGRHSGADCPIRYALDTEENRHRLSTISRIHTRMTARGGRLLVADGPSRNGTFIDEQRLLASDPQPLALNFAKERRFILGQFGFELRVQYFAEGFVRFLLPPTADRSLQPIWLLASATIGSSANAALRLDASFPAAVARVSFHADRGFSLDVPADAGEHLPAICTNGTRVEPGTSVPLQAAQRLTLGQLAFDVNLP